jgi:hypothetical protein
MIDDDCESISGINEWQGKLKYWEKTVPIAALISTDLTNMTQARTPVVPSETRDSPPELRQGLSSGLILDGTSTH